MSITNFQTFIPSLYHDEGDQAILFNWQGKFNWFENTAPMSVTLSNTINFSGNSEIIIRNLNTSTDNITVVFSGFTPDVSADLGLIIPPGGIGELKRIGASTVWSFYGYISA